MDRNGPVKVVLLLILIVADASTASSSILTTFRRFVAGASAGNFNSNQVSPSPSPDPVQTAGNKTASIETKVKKQGENSTKAVNSVSSSEQLNNKTEQAGPPPVVNKGGNDVTTNEKENGENKMDSVGGDQNCTGMPRWCKDDASLAACIIISEPEHKKIVVLVQNEGESDLKVDVSSPIPSESTPFAITKHQMRKVNLTVGDSNQVILKAGNGECVLHIGLPRSQGNFIFNLPSYDRLITPINGAYFLILTVLIFGGMSICCLLRKRKQRDGIPYQELEMALPESSLANNVETAEGWDQGWDDDWDEENAVKSPAIRHSGSISSNGLSSRSIKKEGWEDDWDD
ncbi:uncharacterized protein LOC126665385 [Mercurialis annua]|uniref:uncharacterized protein LOC126665385 n=1 Tax=Mercurialis annua TaxID=3986 RepID=UPI00215DEE7F|nr:uncharacterized protein LOC126665385 [Mercurialis annua]